MSFFHNNSTSNYNNVHFHQSHMPPNNFPIQHSVVPISEITRKKRSGSVDNTIGKPFISSSNSKYKVPRRSFFRDTEHQDDATIDSLINLIRTFSSSQIFRVCLALNIKPPQISTLLACVSTISPEDQKMIDMVKSAVKSVIQPISHNISASQTNTFDNFFDCRYSLPEPAIPPVQELVTVGISPIDCSFVVPPPNPNLHLILQSFVMNTFLKNYGWPHTLRIFVNDICIKQPSAFQFPLLDLSAFPPGTVVRLTCSVEASKYMIVARFAHYESYSALTLKIQNQPVFRDIPPAEDTSFISTLTGQIIKHPGRGKNCQHSQCFDIKEFLKRGNITHEWACPICQIQIPPNEIEYSPATKQVLYHLQPFEASFSHHYPQMLICQQQPRKSELKPKKANVKNKRKNICETPPIQNPFTTNLSSRNSDNHLSSSNQEEIIDQCSNVKIFDDQVETDFFDHNDEWTI